MALTRHRRAAAVIGFRCFCSERRDGLEQFEDSRSFASLVRQCAVGKDLPKGRRVHSMLSKHGGDRDTYLGNLLVQMYGNCGSLRDARMVFGNLNQLNVFSWTIMMTAYTQNGHLQEAKAMFNKMPQQSVVSWNAMVAACAQFGDLLEARNMFERMPDRNVVSWNIIVTAYAHTGQLDEAKLMFERMAERTLVSSTAMIVAYAENGDLDEAVSMFARMPQWNVTSCNAMISAYVQHGDLEDAQGLFDEMPQRDTVSWTAIMTAYAQNGHLQQAKSLFDQAPQRDVASWNALFSSYADGGHLEEAKTMFDKMPERNVISSTAMVTAFALNGHSDDARIMFNEMPQRNPVSWNAMITAYAEAGGVQEAKCVFDNMPQRTVASWTMMVDAYAQSGQLQEARGTFSEMPERNVVSWTTMIGAYAQHGHSAEALELFQLMDLEGVCPDKLTFLSVVDACASLACRAKARVIHSVVVDFGEEANVGVGTALVSMYGKCGCSNDARRVFDKMPERNVVTWNAMAAAYAQNEQGKETLLLFQEMNLEGEEPNSVTFVSVLSVCSHFGMLADASFHFLCMAGDYGVVPLITHYNCIIDLLGRSGRLGDAQELIYNMPFEPAVVSWKTLLAACSMQGNAKRGSVAAREVFELDGQNAAPYVLLSNIHVHAVTEDEEARTPDLSESASGLGFQCKKDDRCRVGDEHTGQTSPHEVL